jgi:sensor domain DACNG-containing protein/sensor domain DACNH-containing protein/DisA checkpoint controller-like protein
MTKSVELFMWGYQGHFESELEFRAKAAIQSIAPTVHPKAILVGVRTPEKAEGYPVCVQPEEGEWDPSIFFGCAERTEQIYESHPDQELYYSDAPSMRDKPENIRRKSVLDAVMEVTRAYDEEHKTRTYCGFPTRAAGYHVVPILQFNETELSEYPTLDEPIEHDRWKSPVSLVESVIERVLEEATAALKADEPGRFILGTFPSETTGILRKAGDRFCDAITLALGDVGLQDIFDTLNVISSLPYEGEEAIGELLFSSPNAEAIGMTIRLNSPVKLQDHKLARKLIEMSGKDLACVCDSAKGISGFGVPVTANENGVFRVTFVGHYKWDLFYGDRILMKAAYGLPHLPLPRLDEERFRSNIRRMFPNCDSVDRLWSIVQAAMDQHRGTVITISDSAQEEATRLRKQSLGIEPTELTTELVGRLTRIDGALLMDPKGVCHAVGVILDGLATEQGDPSRGARFNSAIRYIISASATTICLVVSEDGHIDMLPNLPPQIRRSDVEDQISLLKQQNIENYHKTLRWLQEHRFYLTADQCEVVNAELSRIHSAPYEVGEIRPIISPFVPHPAMNESYYLPEPETESEK